MKRVENYFADSDTIEDRRSIKEEKQCTRLSQMYEKIKIKIYNTYLNNYYLKKRLILFYDIIKLVSYISSWLPRIRIQNDIICFIIVFC